MVPVETEHVGDTLAQKALVVLDARELASTKAVHFHYLRGVAAKNTHNIKSINQVISE